jgi:hypothetical protein
MNAYWIFAFVVTPALVLAIAYLGVVHFERSLDRNRKAPGE